MFTIPSNLSPTLTENQQGGWRRILPNFLPTTTRKLFYNNKWWR